MPVQLTLGNNICSSSQTAIWFNNLSSPTTPKEKKTKGNKRNEGCKGGEKKYSGNKELFMKKLVVQKLFRAAIENTLSWKTQDTKTIKLRIC